MFNGHVVLEPYVYYTNTYCRTTYTTQAVTQRTFPFISRLQCVSLIENSLLGPCSICISLNNTFICTLISSWIHLKNGFFVINFLRRNRYRRNYLAITPTCSAQMCPPRSASGAASEAGYEKQVMENVVSVTGRFP